MHETICLTSITAVQPTFASKQHGTGIKDKTRYKITVKTEAVVCLHAASGSHALDCVRYEKLHYPRGWILP